MKHPLPFRKAFGLFLRNTSPSVSFSPESLRLLGIGDAAATACILVGLLGSVPIILGAAFLALRVVDSPWPLVAVPPFFILCQGGITYLAYRLWHRRCYPAA